MDQLKVMRMYIQNRIIKIEQQEQSASHDLVKEHYNRVKISLKLKFEISRCDEQMTQLLLGIMCEFPLEKGLELDMALKAKEDAKRDKTTNTKSIIREFICNLKTFARNLEEFGPTQTVTEEDEKRTVRDFARLADAKLSLNFAHIKLLRKLEDRIVKTHKFCKLSEELIEDTWIAGTDIDHVS